MPFKFNQKPYGYLTVQKQPLATKKPLFLLKGANNDSKNKNHFLVTIYHCLSHIGQVKLLEILLTKLKKAEKDNYNSLY